MQLRDLEFVGEANTSYLKPDQFLEKIDMPRFHENRAINIIKKSASSLNNLVKNQIEVDELNKDLISEGQLLFEFFQFYGFTFQREKYAIDIRHFGP